MQKSLSFLALLALVGLSTAVEESLQALTQLAKKPYLEMRDHLIKSPELEGNRPSGLLGFLIAESVRIRREKPAFHAEIASLEGLDPVYRQDMIAWENIVFRGSQLTPEERLIICAETLLFDTVDLSIRSGRPELDAHSNVEGKFLRGGLWNYLKCDIVDSKNIPIQDKIELIQTLNAKFQDEAIDRWICHLVQQQKYELLLASIRGIGAAERLQLIVNNLIRTGKFLYVKKDGPTMTARDKSGAQQYQQLQADAQTAVIATLDFHNPNDLAFAKALTASICQDYRRLLDYESAVETDHLKDLIRSLHALWAKANDAEQVKALKDLREQMVLYQAVPANAFEELPSD